MEQIIIVNDKIQRKFEEFHEKNPRIYELYKRFAFELLEAGKKKAGIGLITEHIRWEIYIKTDSDDEFKISNNHRSRYARKLMAEVPELRGFFITKQLRGQLEFI